MKWIIELFIVLILCSCKTKYIEVETVRDRLITNTEYKLDSIYVHDSIVVTSKNDTVYKVKFNTIYRDRVRVDSFVRVDSLVKVQQVPVEKQLTKWEQYKIDAFSYLLVLTLILIFILYILLHKRF